MLLPVIMAGGTGSRLWPMSRELHPKQFLHLHGPYSMLQETLNRLNGMKISEPVIICNKDYRFMVAEQLRQNGVLSHKIISEPIGRNTSPAIALAALNAIFQGTDPIMLVLAADHIIKDVKAFHDVVAEAQPFAAKDSLVIFGIIPTRAETGYGYIHCGARWGDHSSISCVKNFIEKPDLATAQNYIDSKEYFWNSGMFMFRAKRYLEELEKFHPEILAACTRALKNIKRDKNFIKINQEAFTCCPDESIDYAVMEKTQDSIMIPLDAGWSDVGSWSALWELSEKDAANNSLVGDAFLYNSHNCYINTDEKFVAAVGVDNLVIVNTKDAVLVIDKSKAQDVTKVVEHLKKHNRSEHKKHCKIYRPWGICDILVSEKPFHVNRLTINPGEAFSLHLHHYRTEHWVVIAGTAKVTIEDKIFLLTKNQSTFIPVEVVHRLENPGKIPLEVIEMQVGSYLGNDDIVRIKDYYGRC